MKVMVLLLSIIFGTLGTIQKSLEKRLVELEICGKIDYSMIKLVRILRRVLLNW